MAGSGIGVLGIIATLVLIRNRDSRAHVDLGDGSDPVPAPSGSPAPAADQNGAERADRRVENLS